MVDIIIGEVLPTFVYKDALITKVHENTYDIRMSDGRIRNYVENSSGVSFSNGDYVAVLISGRAADSEYKIIGRGKKITEVSSIEVVRV